MKKLLLLVLFITCSNVHSKTLVKLGLNVSSFRHENGESKPGIMAGIAKNIYPFRSFDGFIEFGANLVRKKVVFKNISWPTEFDAYFRGVQFGDAMCNISYLEVPLCVGYSLGFSDNTFRPQLVFGISTYIPITDHHGGKLEKTIYLESDKRGEYDVDYIRQMDAQPYLAFDVKYCLRMVLFKRFLLGFVYSRALNNTYGFSAAAINDKLDSFQVFTGYHF